MIGGVFTAPRSPVASWNDLSKNEQSWVEFLRVISGGSDPAITLQRVRGLRQLLDEINP